MTAILLTAALGVLQAAGPPTRVLLVGNSLTAANDLGAMVMAIAAAAGRPLECETLAFPNFSLEDHWNQGDARRVIARGGWDVVVLQQGPSALPQSRVLLTTYAKRFDEEIRKAGARTAMYMVWPSRARSIDFPGVSRSYRAAASAIRGLLLPAGDAWREAWRLDRDLPLYGPDGFHPSTMGTYLAAIVIHAQIAGGIPSELPAMGLSSSALAVLQQAARQAIAAAPK
jgi:hypothetical protein